MIEGPKIVERDARGRILKMHASKEWYRQHGAKIIQSRSMEERVCTAMKNLPKLLAAARTPEAKAKRVAGIRASVKAKKASSVNAIKLRGMGAAAHPELFTIAAGENHIAARTWHLRSPRGDVYHFRNLAKFLRDNSHMFNAVDLVCRHPTRFLGGACNAGTGIGALNPYKHDGTRKRRVEGSWKGWTWVSVDERALHSAEDLLDRAAQPAIP